MRSLVSIIILAVSAIQFIHAYAPTNEMIEQDTLCSQPSKMREKMSFVAYGVTLLGVLLVIATKKLQPIRSRNIWITYISALLPLLIVRLIINQTFKDPSIIIQTVALTCLGYAQIGYICQIFDYKNRIERENRLSPIFNTLARTKDINIQEVNQVNDQNFFKTCMAAILTAVCYVCTGRAAIALFTNINIFTSSASNIAKGYLEIYEIGITLWAVILSSQIIVGIHYRNTLQQSKFMKEYCTLVIGNILIFMSIIGILIYGKSNPVDQFADISVNDLSTILIGSIIVMENIIVCWVPALYAIFQYKRKSIVTRAIRDSAACVEKDKVMLKKLIDLAKEELELDSLLLWRMLLILKENKSSGFDFKDANTRISRFIFDKYVTEQWNTIDHYDMKREFFPIKKPEDLLDTARLDCLNEVVKERIVLPMLARMQK